MANRNCVVWSLCPEHVETVGFVAIYSRNISVYWLRMEIVNPDSKPPTLQRCHVCNVRNRPERLTLMYMLDRLREDVLGAERGLFITIWHLFTSPQQVTSGFIKGDNLRYYSPLKYFVVMLALSLILPNDSILDDFIIGFISAMKTVDKETAGSFVYDWNALVYLPMVAILALINRLLFREKGYNTAEHLVAAAYGWAHMVLLSAMVFSIEHLLKALGMKTSLMGVLFFIPYFYWLWYCRAVFGQRSLAGWIRAIATLPSALITYFVLVAFGFSLIYVVMRIGS